MQDPRARSGHGVNLAKPRTVALLFQQSATVLMTVCVRVCAHACMHRRMDVR